VSGVQHTGSAYEIFLGVARRRSRGSHPGAYSIKVDAYSIKVDSKYSKVLCCHYKCLHGVPCMPWLDRVRITHAALPYSSPSPHPPPGILRQLYLHYCSSKQTHSAGRRPDHSNVHSRSHDVQLKKSTFHNCTAQPDSQLNAQQRPPLSISPMMLSSCR
jgi:hypothetical protein